MAQIYPFRGTLYDPQTVGDVKDVVAPPYDIIDAAGQQALHNRQPHNVIRLELGLDQAGDTPTNNRYTRAAATLASWIQSGALKRDAQPAIYYHTIEYMPPGSDHRGPTKTLKGFLATVKLEEFGSGAIYPHENTRAAAKTDRLNLLEACRANFSPIWSLYSDPHNTILSLLEQAAKATHPRIEFRDDAGFQQRLWAITDRQVLNQVVTAMQSKPLFIADGHHRYETALNYQRLRRQQAGSLQGIQPYDSVLMLFAPLEDPGLTVLPTHRVLTTAIPSLSEIRDLLDHAFMFHEYRYQAGTERDIRHTFLEILRSEGRTAPMFGLSVQGTDAYYMLELRPSHHPSAMASPREKLDVSILQHAVVAKLCPTQQEQEAILYTKDDHEALDWVAQGKGTGALLLNATKVGEVKDVAMAGERMPHKSTYFFPKPLTGLVINVMEG
jgi:uncharacterized protein (DUF1015 family)